MRIDYKRTSSKGKEARHCSHPNGNNDFCGSFIPREGSARLSSKRDRPNGEPQFIALSREVVDGGLHGLDQSWGEGRGGKIVIAIKAYLDFLEIGVLTDGSGCVGR